MSQSAGSVSTGAAPLGNGHGHGDGHGHGHDGDSDDGDFHVSFSGYLTGFILSLILTAIPFWLVMDGVILDSSMAAIVLLGLGAVQIVVHMVYFLHLNARVEHGWLMMSVIFTVVLLVIALSGSLWIMNHLHDNMHISSWVVPALAELHALS